MTSELTLATLAERGVFARFELPGAAMPARYFHYTNLWKDRVDQLPGAVQQRLRMPKSPRGRVEGFLQDFVKGVPRPRLVGPQGYGMDAPFKRLYPPYEAVAYLRTRETRSFGFFAGLNTFYALHMELKDVLQKNPARYLEYGKKINRTISMLKFSEIDGTSDVELLVTP